MPLRRLRRIGELGGGRQDLAAELTGKEAAVFLPTGTLCNQIAMRVFVRSGHFVVCEAGAHVCG